MGWLGNGYTVADYDGSSRTTYLDPSMIDYPPVPFPIKEGKQPNGVAGEDKKKPAVITVADLRSQTTVRT